MVCGYEDVGVRGLRGVEVWGYEVYIKPHFQAVLSPVCDLTQVYLVYVHIPVTYS